MTSISRRTSLVHISVMISTSKPRSTSTISRSRTLRLVIFNYKNLKVRRTSNHLLVFDFWYFDIALKQLLHRKINIPFQPPPGLPQPPQAVHPPQVPMFQQQAAPPLLGPPPRFKQRQHLMYLWLYIVQQVSTTINLAVHHLGLSQQTSSIYLIKRNIQSTSARTSLTSLLTLALYRLLRTSHSKPTTSRRPHQADC